MEDAQHQNSNSSSNFSNSDSNGNDHIDQNDQDVDADDPRPDRDDMDMHLEDKEAVQQALDVAVKMEAEENPFRRQRKHHKEQMAESDSSSELDRSRATTTARSCCTACTIRGLKMYGAAFIFCVWELLSIEYSVGQKEMRNL